VRRWAFLGALVAVAATLAGSAPANALRTADNLYDARYCEVLVLEGTIPDARVDVYNTIGFSDCPEALWSALDPVALAQELGASAVILNGPRYFLMDFASGKGGRVRSFGGLRTRKLASIPIYTAAELVRRPYVERTVERKNTFEWDGGRVVFELLAPDGSRYVMQSYSQIVDPTLGIEDLPSLGARLALPAGWSYRARVLQDDLTLTARREATIIQDDLLNTYQLEP
jgi:hypothetical protein